MTTPSLSLVIPIYNEHALIETAVEECVIALRNTVSDFEIIVVDDGSLYQTQEILSRLQKKHSELRILRNEINLNVGIALQRGMSIAQKEFVLHSAADMPLPIDQVVKLLPRMASCDVLVIERSQFSGYTPWRWVCSQINRALLKVLFSSPFTDMNFCQIYRRSILCNILPLAKSPAFTTPEMILRARRRGYRVQSVQSPYLPRRKGNGAFGKPHDILWALYDMFRFRSHGLFGERT
jgi:glycosyltransferase involved in cell wall biosynthesis